MDGFRYEGIAASDHRLHLGLIVNILNLLDKGWPFAASALAGVMAFGSLRSDVVDLKVEAQRTHLDHDAITRMEQAQTDMKVDLADIKNTLHRIEQSR
jgi:hypothetical protein